MLRLCGRVAQQYANSSRATEPWVTRLLLDPSLESAQPSPSVWTLEKKFDSSSIPLSQILGDAATGRIQLPDFQRGWVWDDDHIRSLVASVSVSYPIGAVMTLSTGNPDVRFKPRVIEGVELANHIEPDYLLLDGQQRTTSLFLALHSPKAVPTRDSRGKEMLAHYYADMNLCLDLSADRDDAIVSVPENRIQTFRNEITLDLSSAQKEYDAEMFPLDIVLDQIATMNWGFGYMEHGPSDHADRVRKWQEFSVGVVTAFVSYQVPTIQLARSTPKDAVCQVFEKVNTGGVSLTVFELLTATFAADGFNLREDWDQRSAQLKHHPVLGRFASTDFLQVITLLATFERRLKAQVREIANLQWRLFRLQKWEADGYSLPENQTEEYEPDLSAHFATERELASDVLERLGDSELSRDEIRRALKALVQVTDEADRKYITRVERLTDRDRMLSALMVFVDEYYAGDLEKAGSQLIDGARVLRQRDWEKRHWDSLVGARVEMSSDFTRSLLDAKARTSRELDRAIARYLLTREVLLNFE